MRSGTHKSAVEAIRKYVELRGGRAWVLAQSARLYGSAGIPDMWCVLPKRDGSTLALWIEVKVGRDKLSDAQQAFRELAYRAGVPVCVGDCDAVQEYVETLI